MSQDQTGTPLTSGPDDTAALLQQSAQPLGTEPGAGLGGYKEQSTWEAAKAGWQRYTFVNQGVLAAAAVNGVDATDADDPTFNQYEYFARHKGEYADIRDNVLSGHFDEARSESGFKRRAFVIRENNALDQEIANGGLGGQLAGMGLSIFDVTSLIGGSAFVGGAKGLGMAGKVSRGVKIGMVEGAIQEAAIQQMDPTQTWKDAVVNVGFSGVAGGAFGALHHWVAPGNKLDPSHPENPMKPENIGRHEEVLEIPAGGTRDDAIRMTNEQSSGGAAAVTPESAAASKQVLETDTEFATGTGLGGMAQAAFDKMLMWGTPFARLKHMPPVLRGYLTQGMDQFGILNRGMARGQAAAPEAEAIRNNYLHKGKALQEELGTILRKAQLDLGESALGARLKGTLDTMTNGKVQTNRITREEFFGEVSADLASYMTGDLEAAKKIKERLKARGMDDTQVESVYSRIKEASNVAKAHMDRFRDDAVKSGLMDPKLDLGNGYGLPVMYVRGAINKDRSGFENIVLKLLEKEPQEEWLKESGWVRDKVEAADGVQPVEARTWDDIQKDPALLNQVLKEWNGEIEHNLREEAAAAWTSAETRLNRTMAEVEAMTDGLNLLGKEKKKFTVGAARQKARLAEAEWHERKLGTSMARVESAESKVAEIERQYPELFGLRDDAAREKVSSGNALDAVTGKAARAADDAADGKYLTDFLKGERATQHTERSAADIGTWQGKRDRMLAQEEIDRLNAEMRQARNELQEAQANLSEARGEMKAASRQQRNADRWLAATEAKAKERAKHATEADLGPGMREQLEIERDRIDQLQAKVAEAERIRRESIDVWKSARKGLGIGRKELRSAKREFAKTGRIAKKLGDRTPKAQYVESLSRAMAGMEKHPAGMIMDEVPETGRLKERRFKWTPELWEELTKRGFVENDLSHLMDRYTKQMGGRLAWHKSMNGESLANIARKADDDARAWIEQAAPGSKERTRREALREKGLKDLQMVHDRTLGKYDMQDTDPVSWGVKAIQNGAYLRIAGGIAWSSLQDIGTAMFAAPGFFKGLMTQANQYKRIVRDYERELAAGDPKGRAEGLRQLMLLATSMENVAHTGVSTRAVGGGSARDQMGVGNGITRTMTRNIEIAMNNIGDKTTWMTGLNFISDYTRRTAMFVQMGNLREWTKDMSKLTASQRAQLASLGVGTPEAKRFQELFKKYGRDEGKLFDPGLDRWMLEPDGDKWRELFEIVMVKAQNRASYVESFGSTPLMLMDNPVAKLLLQFQSYAFMTTNNFMRAGIQRGAVTGDYLSGTAALGTSVALGVGVAALRGFMNGKDKTEEWSNDPSKLAREVFDRSNLLGAASPYFDAGSKLFGGHINKMVGNKFFEAGTKYSQNNWYESLLGPWLGQIRGMGGAVNDVVNGDMDHAGKKLVRMVPMNQYIRLFQELAKSIN